MPRIFTKYNRFAVEPSFAEILQLTPIGHHALRVCARALTNAIFGQVTLFCQLQNVDGDAQEIATSLWTFVHGLSSLSLDGKYEKVTPNVDIDTMLVRVTPQLLGVA